MPWVWQITREVADQFGSPIGPGDWNMSVSARAFVGQVPLSRYVNRIIDVSQDVDLHGAVDNFAAPLFAPSPVTTVSLVVSELRDCEPFQAPAGVSASCQAIRDPLDASKRVSFCSFECDSTREFLIGSRNTTCDPVTATWRPAPAACVPAVP